MRYSEQQYQSLQQQNADAGDVCMSSMQMHSVCRRRVSVLSASSVLASPAQDRGVEKSLAGHPRAQYSLLRDGLTASFFHKLDSPMRS